MIIYCRRLRDPFPSLVMLHCIHHLSSPLAVPQRHSPTTRHHCDILFMGHSFPPYPYLLTHSHPFTSPLTIHFIHLTFHILPLILLLHGVASRTQRLTSPNSLLGRAGGMRKTTEYQRLVHNPKSLMHLFSILRIALLVQLGITTSILRLIAHLLEILFPGPALIPPTTICLWIQS
jgi:hypothetical protein